MKKVPRGRKTGTTSMSNSEGSFGKLNRTPRGRREAAPVPITPPTRSKTPHYQLQYDLTELASMGLIAEDDFGWSKPDWVKKGFAEVKKVNRTCAK
jgi:hypothetical protein